MKVVSCFRDRTRSIEGLGWHFARAVLSSLITFSTSLSVAFFKAGTSIHFLAVYTGLGYRRDFTIRLYGDFTLYRLITLPFFQWVTYKPSGILHKTIQESS